MASLAQTDCFLLGKTRRACKTDPHTYFPIGLFTSLFLVYSPDSWCLWGKPAEMGINSLVLLLSIPVKMRLWDSVLFRRGFGVIDCCVWHVTLGWLKGRVLRDTLWLFRGCRFAEGKRRRDREEMSGFFFLHQFGHQAFHGKLNAILTICLTDTKVWILYEHHALQCSSKRFQRNCTKRLWTVGFCCLTNKCQFCICTTKSTLQ